MNNKAKIGGRAYANGVRLMNGKLSAKAYYDKNNILQVEVKSVERWKYYDKLKKIPVLRGIVSILMAIAMFLKESIKNPRKYWFVFLVIMVDIIYLLIPSGDTVSGIFTITYFLIPVILLIVFWDVIKEVLKYHGAEHKTVNYYENDCQGDIQSYSRLHRRCGSNVIFYYLIISLIMGFFRINVNLFLMELIYLGVAYELMKYTPESLKFIPFLFQRLVTREPDKKHINAAHKSLKALTCEIT